MTLDPAERAWCKDCGDGWQYHRQHPDAQPGWHSERFTQDYCVGIKGSHWAGDRHQCGCSRQAPLHYEILTPAKDVVCACTFDPWTHKKSWEEHFAEVQQ